MSTLKLQLLLGAVDKITAPLKAITGQSRVTAKDLAAAKAKVRDLEQQSAKIEGFKQLGAQIGVNNAKLQEAKAKFEEVKRTIAATANPTRMMVNEFNKAEKAVQGLSAKQTEMNTRYEGMKRSLQSATMGTKDLAKTQELLKNATAAANEKLKQQQNDLDKVAEQQKRLNKVRANYRHTQELRGQITGHGATALATGTAAGMTTLKPVIEFSKAETAVTDLRVSMMGAKGLRKEFQQISDLATRLGNRLPGTSADFQNMMSTLIQQGMTEKAILGGLGEATAYLGVQLKKPYNEAALFAAKLQDATGTAEKDMMGLMDTIQRSYYLGVDDSNMLGAFSALTPALSILRKAGLDAANTLAPLIIMADQADLSGESAGNAYRKIFQMSMNTNKIQKATKGTGLSLNFTDGKGEFGGLEQMYAQLAKLKNLSTEKRLQVLKDIYGDDRETLQALDIMIKKGISGYRETQKKMADQASLQERVNAQLGTMGNLWDAATGTFTNALVNFGESVSPEVKAVIEWIGNLSERLANWSKQNPELSRTIMRVAALVSAVTIAFGALSLTIAAILGPMAILKLSMSVLGIKVPLLGLAFGKLADAIKLVGSALVWAGRAMMAHPIIAAVMIIAGAAVLIYTYWDKLPVWFKSVWDRCKAPFMAAWKSIQQAFSWNPISSLQAAWGSVSQWFAGVIEPCKAPVMEVWQTIKRVLSWSPISLVQSAWGSMSQWFAGVIEPCKTPVMAAWQAIKKALSWSPISLLQSAWGSVSQWFAGVIEPCRTPVMAAWQAIKQALSWNPISLLQSAWGSVSQWFAGVIEPCKAPVQSILQVMKQVFAWTPLGLITSNWNSIWAFFDTLPEGAMNKGRAIVSGLIDGITAKWRDLIDAVKNLTKYLPDWVTGGGVTISQENVSGPSYLTGNGSGGLAMSGGGGYAPTMYTPPQIKPVSRAVDNSINSPVTIYAQPGQNAQDIGRQVRAEFQRLIREQKAASRASLGDTH